MPRLLLIEDDAETAKEITAELVDRGFQVDWAFVVGKEVMAPGRESSAGSAARRAKWRVEAANFP